MKTNAASLIVLTLVLFSTAAYRSDSSPAGQLRGSTVTPTIYVAQASSGSGDGSSCANAKPATFFNTASNWGAGHTIAPGTIVGLCGTITSTLVAQRSGTRDKPVTVYFTLGARISKPVCPYASDGSAGCLVISNLGYITVDGGTNGIIESTANGTNLANHAGSTGIGARACNNCTIENLTVQNIYVIANPDNHWGTGGLSNSNTNCVNYSGVNWSIHDNTFHDAGWCLYEYSQPAGTDSADIYHNNIYNIDHGWIITGAGNYGKLVFRDNHMHDLGTWDPCTACHHDGIHCFFGSNGNTFSSGPFIYNNVFDGTVGSVDTAWIYLEANPSSGCSSSGSHWYIFNNIITSSDEVPTNGYIGSDGTYAAKTYMYNNTISGPGLGHYGANNAACVFVVSVFENNADGGCARIVSTSGANPLDYNAYANGQSNRSSSGNCWPMVNNCDFTGWKSASGDDAHSVYNYRATVGSNAAGIGTNLTSLCTGDLVPLCSDINGALRPLRMAWDAGAYQGETAAITTRAIGRARIGTPKGSIEQFYGPRRVTHSKRPLFGVFDIGGALTATYQVHRGQLRVSYVEGRTVAISTTSRYYSTTRGFGVGAQVSEAKLAGGGWQRCGPTFVKRRGSIATAVRLVHGLVVALSLARAENLRCS